MFNIECSCCGEFKASRRLAESKIIPGARFVICGECEENGFEPRPIVVLGSIYPVADNTRAKRHIKYQLYHGDIIRADEIIK